MALDGQGQIYSMDWKLRYTQCSLKSSRRQYDEGNALLENKEEIKAKEAGWMMIIIGSMHDQATDHSIRGHHVRIGGW